MLSCFAAKGLTFLAQQDRVTVILSHHLDVLFKERRIIPVQLLASFVSFFGIFCGHMKCQEV